MGIKFSSIMFIIFTVFIVKISLENFGDAKASVKNQKNPISKSQVKLSSK